MHPKTPRMQPLDPAAFTDEQAELAGGRDGPRAQLNIVRILVQNPALYRSWMPFAMHLIGQGTTLSPREREIIILRTCKACNAKYDLAQHYVIAKRAGLTQAEIDAAVSDGAGLSDFERSLLSAVDELVQHKVISDATWPAIAARYSPAQQLDLLFTVGNYTLMAMTTNSLGVQVESDVENSWKPN
jgi:alkylhydroperoxidase family enzyme